MKKMSKSEASPFDNGVLENLSIILFYKYKENEKSINEKGFISNEKKANQNYLASDNSLMNNSPKKSENNKSRFNELNN